MTFVIRTVCPMARCTLAVVTPFHCHFLVFTAARCGFRNGIRGAVQRRLRLVLRPSTLAISVALTVGVSILLSGLGFRNCLPFLEFPNSLRAWIMHLNQLTEKRCLLISGQRVLADFSDRKAGHISPSLVFRSKRFLKKRVVQNRYLSHSHPGKASELIRQSVRVPQNCRNALDGHSQVFWCLFSSCSDRRNSFFP